MIGSRRRNTRADFDLAAATFRKIYTPGDRLVSGGCPQGGDRFAEVIAIELAKPGHYHVDALLKMEAMKRHHIIKELGAPILIHHARWDKFGRIAGVMRNTGIARDADILIAIVTPDRTGGTEDTIRKFLMKGKYNEDLILI